MYNIIKKKSSWLLSISGIAMIAVIFSCTGTEPEKPSQEEGQVHAGWSKNASIYEVNIRQYTPEGTFEAFNEHLPRLKEMGVDILWLMPVHPIGVEKRKGTLGSYYSVKDYKGINPEFGDMEDFKALVNEIHELDMKIVLDWVANHTAWDNWWIEEHPEWYTRDDEGNFVSPYDWSDVADLNYDNADMRQAMIDALKFWVVEADIDGYRCDVAGEVPLDFWDNAISQLRELKPVFMLAESEVPEHHDVGFDMTYAWELHHLMNMIAQGKAPADTLNDYHLKQDTLFPDDAYRMIFTSNHDENSWNGTVFERMGDGAKTFAVLSLTFPGMPLIYSGQEAAMDKRLEFFEKDKIEWGNFEYQDFYKTLLELKSKNSALWNGEHGGSLEFLNTNAPASVIAFVRQNKKDLVLSILNLSSLTHDIMIEAGDYPGSYTELFSEKSMDIGPDFSHKLGPWEYKVLVK